jgi:transcriptional regulator
MYSPPYNRPESRVELVDFMRANNFPVLVTGTGGVLHASHLPVTVHEDGEQIVIDMHMAKNNPQWKEFFDEDVLVIFSGPHAYVSPRWYEDQERVPTWNYAAVHAYGVAKIHEASAAKAASQRRLIESVDPQWLAKHDALRPEYVEQMLNGIVNFSIAVTRIDARWKLSQNRGKGEMERIAAALDKSADSVEKALAALTRKHYPAK